MAQFINENTIPNYIATSSEISSSKIPGCSRIGMTVLTVDDGVYYIIKDDLTLVAYTLPTSGGGGGGGAVTIANGADIAEGSTTQSKATDGSTTSWSVIQLLKGIFDKLLNSIAVTGTFWQATQPVSSTQLPAALGANGALKIEGVSSGTTIPVTSTPAASEVHIGAMGGKKASSEISFTRPADTTAYTALDSVNINLAITGATNATPIVITSATHSLADGDPVTIASVGGNTAANGNFYAKVTSYSSTTFALYSDKALTTAVAGNGNYTSGGTICKPFRFVNAARIISQGGYIVKAQIFTDQKTNVARFKLHLFNSPPPGILDNSPYLTLWTNRTSRSGPIIFPAVATEDPTNSTEATALANGNVSGTNLPMSYLCQTGDADLYGLLETLDAFTPASAQNFYIRLSLEQD